LKDRTLILPIFFFKKDGAGFFSTSSEQRWQAWDDETLRQSWPLAMRYGGVSIKQSMGKDAKTSTD